MQLDAQRMKANGHQKDAETVKGLCSIREAGGIYISIIACLFII